MPESTGRNTKGKVSQDNLGEKVYQGPFEELSHRVKPGMYYVTVRTKGGECVFGDVVSGEMRLSELGKIVDASWLRIPEHFPHTHLDIYQIMPNHIHGIVKIGRLEASDKDSTCTDLINQVHTRAQGQREGEDQTGKSDESTSGKDKGPTWPLMKHPEQPLGKIIRSFKAEATKKIHDAGGNEFAWLGRFYEHVIRDGKDLDRIRKYILDNPANWANDENFPGNIRMDKMHEGEDLPREITVWDVITGFSGYC